MTVPVQNRHVLFKLYKDKLCGFVYLQNDLTRHLVYIPEIAGVLTNMRLFLSN